MATDQWPSGNFPEVPDEFVDQMWSSLLSKVENRSLGVVDAKTLELEMQDKQDTEKSHREAEKAKVKFTEILQAWDAEHDREKSNTKAKRGKESIIVKVRANVSQIHSWEDVFASLQEAEGHYKNSSKVRKFFRRGTSKSEAVEPLVGLIPDNTYTSVICAGIKFILGACSAANKSRQDIITLVESLPERIDSASQYAELYSSEAILQTATSRLYVKILTAMESIIAFWTKDRSFEFLKPLFLQSTYTPLQDELDNLRKASENVERTIQLCNQRRLAQVADGVKGSQATVYEIKMALKQLFAQQYVNAKSTGFREALIQTQQLIVQPFEPRPSVTAKNILERLKIQSPYLFPSLDHSPSLAPLQQVLRTGFSMAGEDQHRATWSISDPKVYEWFKSRRSRALIINGNCSLQRVSPLSFFSALLIESLQSLEPIVVLHHFCGLHTTGESLKNQDAGSSAMIGIFLYQLAMQWKFGELSCLSEDDAQVFKTSETDLTDGFLLSIFSKMVKALPRRQPLFAFIDGLNYYETQEFGENTKRLMKRLMKLLAAPASVKLLITSATRVLDSSKYFENDEKLLVPADPVPRGFGPPGKQLKRRFTFGRSAKKH